MTLTDLSRNGELNRREPGSIFCVAAFDFIWAHSHLGSHSDVLNTKLQPNERKIYLAISWAGKREELFSCPLEANG